MIVRVKYLVRALLILPALLIAAVIGAVMAFNAGMFQDSIQKQVNAALGPDSSAHLGKMQLLYRWPPLVRINSSVVDMPVANLQWQNLDAELLKIQKPYSVALNFNQLHVIVKPPPATPAAKIPSGAGGGGAASKPPPLALKIQVVNGEIKTDYADLTNLNFKFEQKLLMKSPAAVHLTAGLRFKFLPVDLPLQADSDKLTFSDQAVKTADLRVTLGGLSSNVQGTSLLTEGRHRWLFEVTAKDLAQLPQPPMANIPAKKWRGEVRLKAEVNKLAADKPWSAEGEFFAKNVGADVDFKQDKVNVKGPFSLEADGKFSYLNERMSLPNLKASLDLTGASVIYQDMLNKSSGVAMKASVTAAGDPQKLNIQEMLFDLWNFSGKVSGGVELQAPFPGDLQFSLKPVNLAGAEQLLLPLKASPVQGELSVSGSVHGPLMDPMKARIVADAMNLKKFSGVLNFEREGLAKIRGPVTIDVQAKGEFNAGAVKSAEGKGTADLSAAALVAGPLRKEEKAELKIRFGVRNAGKSILIDEIDLASFIGHLSLKGKADMLEVPTIDMNFEAKPLLLSELRIAMPSFHDLVPKGTLNGRWSVKGKLEMTKPWSDWPLTVNGSTDVKISEYKMVPAPQAPAPAPGAPAPAAPVSTSFLPDGQLTRQLRMNVKVLIDQFVKEPLIAKAVSTDGLIAGGKFTGAVNIGQIFGGSVQLKNLAVPLLAQRPKIQGNVNWLNLVIEDAIAFAKPEYKGFAAGRTGGLADFATVMPDQPDFMAQLKARGDAIAQPVVFNSVKIGEMVNAQIAKVPQLKLKPMKVDPLRGQAKVQFDLNNGVAEIGSFQGVDVDNSEIQMKGKVVLASMTGDFAGTFYWNDPPIKGCPLEGNADAKGRLVVPIAIKGNLMQPGFSLLSDVIGKLAAKSVECEGNKLVEKVKAEGKQKLEKELKNTLKGLLGH